MLRVMAVGVTRARVDVVCVVQHIMSIKNQHNIDEQDNCAYDDDDDKSIAQAVNVYVEGSGQSRVSIELS